MADAAAVFRVDGLEQELHSWASTGYHPIPRTIHQLWKTTEIPEVHHSNVETWKAKNDGFAYKLWTDLEMNAHMKVLVSRYQRCASRRTELILVAAA